MPRIVPKPPIPPTLEEVSNQWVDKYGEAVSQSKAAQILGCDRSTVWRLVRAEILPTTPHKKVLVRPMSEWAYRDFCSKKLKRKAYVC